jgi:hypothetical protein
MRALDANAKRSNESLSEAFRSTPKNGEVSFADRIDAACLGDKEAVIAFLESSELWGGAGSIADQAGLGNGERNDNRREVEKLLVNLGDEQIRINMVNRRTNMWITVFKEWHKNGI